MSDRWSVSRDKLIGAYRWKVQLRFRCILGFTELKRSWKMFLDVYLWTKNNGYPQFRRKLDLQQRSSWNLDECSEILMLDCMYNQGGYLFTWLVIPDWKGKLIIGDFIVVYSFEFPVDFMESLPFSLKDLTHWKLRVLLNY